MWLGFWKQPNTKLDCMHQTRDWFNVGILHLPSAKLIWIHNKINVFKNYQSFKNWNWFQDFCHAKPISVIYIGWSGWHDELFPKEDRRRCPGVELRDKQGRELLMMVTVMTVMISFVIMILMITVIMVMVMWVIMIYYDDGSEWWRCCW